jgi:hypothetical protein
MANIKNFGLVGVATDVQFGKAGPRLINDTNVFTFKNAAGSAAAPINAGNATIAGLTVGATATIDMGANKVTNVANGTANGDAINFSQLTAAVADAVAQAAANTTALQTEVNAIETAVGLGTDGTLVAFAAGSAAFGKTSFKEALEAVGAALTGEIADRATAVTGVSDALAAEVARATAAEALKLNLTGGTLTGALILNADPTLPLGAATKNYVDSVAGGLTWQAPVTAKVADIAARDALTSVAGDRVLVDADNKIYTFDGADFDGGQTPSTSWALFDDADQQGWVFNGTAWVQFTGTGQIVAGLGLLKNGNRLDVQVSSTGGLHFTPDEVGADSTLTLKLDGSSLSMSATGVKVSDALTTEITALRTDLSAEVTARGAAITAVQGELDATQAGAGLSAAGAYVAETTSNYINSATTLKGADFLLDAQIKSVSDALAALGSGSITALQDEVDAIEGAVGLNTDGTFATFTGTNYLNSATSVVSSLTALDVALKAMDTAYKAADTALNSSLLAYVDGKVTLLEGEISDAIDAAAADATAKADQALVDSKAYTDSKISAGVANAGRAVYATFTATGSATVVDLGTVKGMVHRVKVYITAAGATDADVQVGTLTVNNQLASTADVDSTGTGVYVVEVNQIYATDTALKIFVAAGTVAGTVVVEYL